MIFLCSDLNYMKIICMNFSLSCKSNDDDEIACSCVQFSGKTNDEEDKLNIRNPLVHGIINMNLLHAFSRKISIFFR